MDTNVYAAQEIKASVPKKNILLGLGLTAGHGVIISPRLSLWPRFAESTLALMDASRGEEKGWMIRCLHRKLENHKFRFFFSTRRSKLIHRAGEMHFLNLSHTPANRNECPCCIHFLTSLQIPAFCLLASKISISNLSPLQGRGVNRLPCCCCCWWWWCSWRNKPTTVDVVVFVWVLAVFVISLRLWLWLPWTGEHKQSHEVKKPVKLCNTKKKENRQNHQGQTSREKTTNACLVFAIVSTILQPSMASATFGRWTPSCCMVFAACLNFNLPFRSILHGDLPFRSIFEALWSCNLLTSWHWGRAQRLAAKERTDNFVLVVFLLCRCSCFCFFCCPCYCCCCCYFCCSCCFFCICCSWCLCCWCCFSCSCSCTCNHKKEFKERKQKNYEAKNKQQRNKKQRRKNREAKNREAEKQRSRKNREAEKTEEKNKNCRITYQRNKKQRRKQAKNSNKNTINIWHILAYTKNVILFHKFVSILSSDIFFMKLGSKSSRFLLYRWRMVKA